MFAARNMWFAGGLPRPMGIVPDPYFDSGNVGEWLPARASTLDVIGGALRVTRVNSNSGAAINLPAMIVGGQYRLRMTLRNLDGGPAWYVRTGQTQGLNAGIVTITNGFYFGVGGQVEIDVTWTNTLVDQIWFGFILVWNDAYNVEIDNVILEHIPSFDADAADYFDRIIAAGSSIGTANKDAVNNFVVGCKADGIWDAIKASCLLAGPDSLAGALVPLVGAAPTNYNFVSGDYSRTTGLVGDGSTKYLDSNRNNSDDPQNSRSFGMYITQANTSIGAAYLGFGVAASGSQIISFAGGINARVNSSSGSQWAGVVGEPIGLVGVSRSLSTGYFWIAGAQSGLATNTSSSPYTGSQLVYSRFSNPQPSSPRAAFYWFGESLDLALLDARITTYMAALT